ncbi:MAG: phosphatase PAP2 family protein [Clostridium sp.]|nr:phosphatase PAP2 family protein [Clostridium sp.]
MFELLNTIDTEIFLFFNGLHTGFSDSFMKAFSGRFIWIPMYATLLVMVLKAFPLRKAAVIVVGVAAAIALTDQTCASLIRPFFERLRPSNLANPLSELTHIVDGYRGGAYGFPSCHAANSFALATFMSLIFRLRKFNPAIFSWAFLNSYSRICLGVHYPGDLLVGALVGAFFGWLCYKGVKYAGFGGLRPVRTILSRETSSEVLFVTPAGYLSPLLRATTIRVRHTDLFFAVLFGTVLTIILTSL